MPKVRTVSSITVVDFIDSYATELEMTLIGKEVGFDRLIGEPTINRPGLALSGFIAYFAHKRIQAIGHCEISFLKKQTIEDAEKNFTAICKQEIPCLVVAREHLLSENLMEIANDFGIPVFQTPKVTMDFINAATLRLQAKFANQISMHGCMIDYRGTGVLITGASGSGKSETAIGLLDRGGALVADDLVHLKDLGTELSATGPELARGYLEMRGIGIINAANLYGLSAIRLEKRLDLIVKLKPLSDLNKVDRHGINRATQEVLGHQVPVVEIPVAPGRDTTRLIAVAALDQQLRQHGYDMANEFNKRLLEKMSGAQ